MRLKNSKRCFQLFIAIAAIFVFTGCAVMTMPRANMAVGQLRVGNEKKAWSLIYDEVRNPAVKTRLELCEMHGIFIQILQQTINKDFVSADAADMAQTSYDYVCENCRDFNMITGVTEHNYGRLLMSLGKSGYAIPHLKKSARFVQKGSYEEIMLDKCLGDIYDELGKFELRDYHKDRAMSIGRAYFQKPRSYRWNTDEFDEQAGYAALVGSRINDLSLGPETADRLQQMNILWQDMERFALRWVAKEQQYLAYSRVAQMYAQAGYLDTAWRLYHRAEQLVKSQSRRFKKQAEADLLATRAQILKAEKNYAQAGQMILQWIRNYRKIYQKPPSSGALSLAGVILETAGNYDDAIEYLEKCIAGIETLRTSFDVQMRDTLIGGRPIVAYWSLLRAYAARYLKTGDEKDFIHALRVSRMIRGRQFGELLNLKYRAGDLPDLNALKLTPDEILLDVVQTDRALVLFAISQTRHELFLVPTFDGVFDAAARRLKAGLSRPDVAAFNTSDLFEISNTLLGPISSYLADKQKVIFIPDGVLNAIPLSALSVSQHSYAPLVMSHKAALMPSLTYLIQERRQDVLPTSESLFALGDPEYGDRQAPEVHQDQTRQFFQNAADDFALFAPLPETRREVERIQKMFPAGHVRMIFGKEARESVVKSAPLADYRFVHFATHGVLGNQIPGVDEPALVLAAEEAQSPNDGYLTMSEVQQLKLNCELAVLSACDTGSGEYFTGEGVMGLSRAFLLAGSRSVIVSLWPVASDATVALMEQFYKNLRSGKTKAESLRLAQVKVFQQDISKSGYRGIRLSGVQDSNAGGMHPFFWAPFVLIGE